MIRALPAIPLPERERYLEKSAVPFFRSSFSPPPEKPRRAFTLLEKRPVQGRHAREEQGGCFLADFRAAQQVGAFLHGEAACLHVPDDAGLLLLDRPGAAGGDAFAAGVAAADAGSPNTWSKAQLKTKV